MNLLKKIPEQIQQLPKVQTKAADGMVCGHCNYVNNIGYSFCTNCGYPLNNNNLVGTYEQKLKKRRDMLFKAENSVLIARVVLYLMAIFMMLGIFIIFSEGDMKYFIAIVAFIMSCVFFFLALWSRRNPFSAMLTSFIVLITFSAINIFDKLIQSFTTTQGLLGLVLCLALLFIVLRGVQGAYRVGLIKQELQTKL